MFFLSSHLPMQKKKLCDDFCKSYALRLTIDITLKLVKHINLIKKKKISF